MSDFIKREDAIIAITDYILNCGFFCDTDEDAQYSADAANKLLSDIPSADVVERKVGRWVLIDSKCGRSIFRCTRCTKSVYVPTAMGIPLFNYCPNCDARMDGDT